MLTDGRTDNGRKVITIAHPEQSSGELKKKRPMKDMTYDIYAMFIGVCVVCLFFLLFFFSPIFCIKSIRCRYSFELHQQVNAI